MIEVLEAKIEEQQEEIKRFKEDEYDNNVNHASDIRQAKTTISQLKMEVDQLQIKIDTEDYYDYYED